VIPAYHERTAADLAAAFRRRELTPLDAARAALARIAELEPKLNAMYRIDRDGAIDQARAAEARWESGRPLSALDGVPITIKENIYTRGAPAPIGTRANEDAPPQPEDAPPAARLREAGCVILGKTTMPDYGMLSSGVSSLHGVTRNPWRLDRNPSGSSSGAGAACAAGYAPLHLGTDIGGSVRLPATHCGIFALKPSLGRVPCTGDTPARGFPLDTQGKEEAAEVEREGPDVPELEKFKFIAVGRAGAGRIVHDLVEDQVRAQDAGRVARAGDELRRQRPRAPAPGVVLVPHAGAMY